jgi:hypothetical protein
MVDKKKVLSSRFPKNSELKKPSYKKKGADVGVGHAYVVKSVSCFDSIHLKRPTNSASSSFACVLQNHP